MTPLQLKMHCTAAKITFAARPTAAVYAFCVRSKKGVHYSPIPLIHRIYHGIYAYAFFYGCVFNRPTQNSVNGSKGEGNPHITNRVWLLSKTLAYCSRATSSPVATLLQNTVTTRDYCHSADLQPLPVLVDGRAPTPELRRAMQ